MPDMWNATSVKLYNQGTERRKKGERQERYGPVGNEGVGRG